MRICIYGAGATGGHFAVKLARAGHDISVIARGPHLVAIRENGLTLRSGNELLAAEVAASDNAKDFGVQDVVIVAVKATAIPLIAPQIAPVIGHDTLVVFPQNGMTWWYPLKLSPKCPTPPKLPIFDLGEAFLKAMRLDQIVGGLIYSANEVEAPGIIRNNSPDHNRMDIGAIDGRGNDIIADLRKALSEADIISTDPGDIRAAVWAKLLTNMSGSTLALATGNRSDGTRDDAALREIYMRIVREGLAIAAAHGFPLDDKLDPERMVARLLNHKPSLLQDYEQRRPMEIAEIVLAPVAFARSVNLATPTLDTVAAIVTRIARDRGLLSPTIGGPALSPAL
ncbi:ketopantoate reductase family protein [Pseudorhodoplanes sinuspersici]|uniref:ketopantoate reductase family protein n=1 Tax=Pseudorhodoplanes sinuspersici TaxID=1235591 RepID=UPI000FF4AED1|nr:ketopantoate reductase family protein [Pseudorhodoplanes sinuspersici]RKE69651.1 ketopantoate reductase [Pseudorhodoplanes sinuspersici]